MNDKNRKVAIIIAAILGCVGLFYLGGMGHLNNVSFLGQTITGGTIVTFYMYISKFFTPIQNLAEQFNWLQSALASSEKVFSLMDIEPKMVDAPDAV